MKYDVLHSYKAFLVTAALRPSTARTYTNRLEILLKEQDCINTVENLDIDKIIDNLSKINYKNHFSQSKNALLYFLQFQGLSLNLTQQNRIKELEQKTHKKNRHMKEVKLSSIQNTIKHLKNKKLKLCYLTLLATGLRVSELSQITPEDTTILDNEMNFTFIGKGGNKESATLTKEKNPDLFKSLLEHIKNTSSNKKLFYSSQYLQQKAKYYGFCCHDLRRAFAKLEYKKSKSKEMVRESLRHKSLKTTDKYLKSKVKI